MSNNRPVLLTTPLRTTPNTAVCAIGKDLVRVDLCNTEDDEWACQLLHRYEAIALIAQLNAALSDAENYDHTAARVGKKSPRSGTQAPDLTAKTPPPIL